MGTKTSGCDVRLALFLGCLWTFPLPVLADCRKEVEAAWLRTLATPFDFELTSIEEGPKHEFMGAVQWPTAMHYSTIGPNGRHEEYYVNGRNWMFGDGRWQGGKQGSVYSGSEVPESAVRFYAAFFGIRGAFSGFNGKGFEPAPLSPVICAGEVMRNSVKHILYKYDVTAVAFGAAIDRDTIYVDSQTGLVSRQEVERRSNQTANTRKSHYTTEFRPNPSLVIKPPEEATR